MFNLEHIHMSSLAQQLIFVYKFIKLLNSLIEPKSTPDHLLIIYFTHFNIAFTIILIYEHLIKLRYINSEIQILSILE